MSRAGTLKGLAIVALILLFIGAILSVHWPTGTVPDDQNVTNRDVGNTMFGTSGNDGYGLIMLSVGVLLLVALLGGIFLAKEEKGDEL